MRDQFAQTCGVLCVHNLKTYYITTVSSYDSVSLVGILIDYIAYYYGESRESSVVQTSVSLQESRVFEYLGKLHFFFK